MTSARGERNGGVDRQKMEDFVQVPCRCEEYMKTNETSKCGIVRK
jgi:hypothetical protein